MDRTTWHKTVATSISYNGFLSDEANEKSEVIKQEHKQLFFYLDDVNKQAHLSSNVVQPRMFSVRYR
jgi:hypothetical protein